MLETISSDAQTNWDSCSLEYFRRRFSSEGSSIGTHSNCTEEPSSTSGGVWASTVPVCGDGFVQGSEECDCINNDCSLVDPCCNGQNCTLKAGAQCSAQDACCIAETCQIQTDTQTVCRPSISMCDFTERCDGVSSKCPWDKFSVTGVPCLTKQYLKSGTCYYKECVDAAEECIIRGSEQSDPISQWIDTCSDKVTGDFDKPLTSACSIVCRQPKPKSGCESYKIERFYADGTQCETGKGCYNGICTPFDLIPAPIDPKCSNFQLDSTETDIDCGGPCFGCAPGKLCARNGDCLYPSKCNTKVLYTNANGWKLGVCDPPSKEPTSIVDQHRRFQLWFEQNAHIWGPVLLVIIVFLIACAFFCCRRRRQRMAREKAAASARRSLAVSHRGFSEWSTTNEVVGMNVESKAG